jgi:Ca-activated chloride channel family protein
MRENTMNGKKGQVQVFFLAVLTLLMVIVTACGAGVSTPTAELLTAQPPSPTALPTAAALLNRVEGESIADSGTMAAALPPAEPLAQMAPAATPAPGGPPPEDMFFEDYGVNPFLDTEDDHLSTFAMDVDTASYTLARSYLMDYGQLPPADAIRPEEFINYFDVGYEGPEEGAFAIHLDAAPAPFGFAGHYLLRVGLQGRYIAPEDRDPSLLIFVIDVSGSMDRGDRLGLVKQALALLVGELRADDRVGIIVYSDDSRAILDPTPASDAATIMRAINALRPEGSTNVVDGLRLGYQMAENYRRAGQITRVIVLSDGVANVGITEPGGMLETIQHGVNSDITLSTVGFGMSNYNDVLMEQLADDGNGNYYYVDTLREARRIFVHNLTGTLQVIGYDAKVQVDFNPEVTDRYRLIGYENRAIADEDFRDDTVDAGEIGAGHSVTALYELAMEDGVTEGVVATVSIRYRDAETNEVVEQSRPLTVAEMHGSLDETPPDFRLHACAAELSELLRGSYWAQDGNYVDLLALAAPLVDEMPGNEEVAEFVELIRLAGRYVDSGG